MTDLADFLLARIEDDETTATSAAVHLLDGGRGGFGDVPPEVWAHVRAWRTARVLKECEAKRRIVKLDICTTCAVEAQPCEHQYETMRLLALPYADHPEYREEWRP